MSPSDSDAAPAQTPSIIKIAWAACLSLLSPGLGQVYAKAWPRGLLLLLLFLVLSSTTLAFIFLAHPTRVNLAALAGLLIAGLGLRLWSGFDAAAQLKKPRAATKQRWYKSTWTAFLVTAAASAALIAIGAAAQPVGWVPYTIPSLSNYPTLLTGDYIIADPLHSAAELQRGDIITFHPASEPGDIFMKRLIGLPGDQIQLIGGLLYVNQQFAPRIALGPYCYSAGGQTITAQQYRETLLRRSYRILQVTTQGFANNTPVYVVPPGYVFVLGDNRDHSDDSRFGEGDIGYVPEQNIIAKAAVTVWPLSHFKMLD